MKPNTSRSLFNLRTASLLAMFTIAGAAKAFACALIDSKPAWLGVADHTYPASYASINATRVADLTSMTNKAQEEIWVKRVLMGADQANVFSDNMIGGPGSGKPFIQYNDLSKVDGNTINVPTLAALGGPGAQGEGDRIGNEEKIRIGNFPVKIGRQWFGVGITDVAQEETVIGGTFDNVVNELLRKRLGRKKSEDMLMTLKSSALSSNTVYPNFKATRESLRSSDVVGTATITNSSDVISSLGGKPVKTTTNPAGGFNENFIFFSHQYGLKALKDEEKYLMAIRNAGIRGDANPIFKGDYTDWDGNGIYRWLLRDHDAYGPVGSAILPRAFLGTAITAGTTAPTITGGGSTDGAAALPAPRYFENFSNALYTFCNGLTVAADTTTVRYLAIQNLTGSDAGKIGFYSFQVNSGTTITVLNRLRAAASGAALTTVGNVTWDTTGTNPWNASGSGSYSVPDGSFAGLTDAHPVGSLIVETNSYGVPICGSFMLGEMAGICGHGSLKGRNAMAARTFEDRNHGMEHGIGVETCFGTAAVKRTDSKVPNYVYVESTYTAPGFPFITG